MAPAARRARSSGHWRRPGGRAIRILIDTTYSERAPHSGTAVYTRMLCQELSQADGVELIPVSNPRRRVSSPSSIRNVLADERWLAIGLPRLAARARADVIHHPLPARARGTTVAQVITVHDLSFERLPDSFDRRFRLYAHLSHRAGARAAAVVICVSQTTAADVREIWGITPERIVVARHGPGQALPSRSGVRGPEPQHFLYVGDDEPRKNLETLLAAHRLYRERLEHPLPLVLAGSATAAQPLVRIEPAPGPQHLSDLYANAAALIQPSLYEGFGLTALEAMRAGTPVLAARSPGLLETCGEAALWFEARDVSGLARAMEELASQPGRRRELAERGQVRASGFSWSRCAHDHLSAYSLAVGRA